MIIFSRRCFDYYVGRRRHTHIMENYRSITYGVQKRVHNRKCSNMCYSDAVTEAGIDALSRGGSSSGIFCCENERRPKNTGAKSLQAKKNFTSKNCLLLSIAKHIEMF